MKTDIKKSEELLVRGVEEVIERDHLKSMLLSGRKLRIKWGIDPTASDIHLGHSVVLRKLKQFQDFGHKIVLIIGDFTAKIGDPTGRSETRKILTTAEVKKNMKGYLAQAGKIINIKKTEIRYNSEWLDPMKIPRFIELSRSSTLQQILSRADFRKRHDEGNDISLLEFSYPLLQGYDSVEVRADVEMGGTDQKFNLLVGRKVQRHFKQAEQDVVMVPLLEGVDGERKMSKSYGNYIGLTEAPGGMFGKIMSIPDKIVVRYFTLCTDVPVGEIKGLSGLHPMEFKTRLAYEIVRIYHGEKDAKKAQEEFMKTFSKKEVSDDIPVIKTGGKKLSIADVVKLSGIAKSNGDVWRLVKQGAVEIDGKKFTNPTELYAARGGETLKIGKKSFFRLKI